MVAHYLAQRILGMVGRPLYVTSQQLQGSIEAREKWEVEME